MKRSNGSAGIATPPPPRVRGIRPSATARPGPEPARPASSSYIQDTLYLPDSRYPTREALEAEVDFWDATTAGWYGWCPRVAQYSHRMGLVHREEALPLITGSAIHAGMHVLYTSGDEELALQALVETFGEREPPPPSHKYAHLHLGFIEAIFKNYLVWRRKTDTFTPLAVHYDDLDLSQVVAAMFKTLPDGRVVLGESKLVMRFVVDGNEFIYAGKPDLPILLGGSIRIFDHKTSCKGYLSDWYFEKHVISNQLRGYCAMLTVLLRKLLAQHRTNFISGAYINGVYAGDKALEDRTPAGKPSKVVKFTRFGPLKFHQSHLGEALWNQYAWRQMAFVYQELAEQHPKMYEAFGYPQNTGKSCQGCHFLGLCQSNPQTRVNEIHKHFVQRRRQFLDL